MQASDIPAKYQTKFAVNAGPSYIRTVPQTTTDPNAASYDLGFPPNTFTPLGGGGAPPDGRDFQNLFQVATAWLQWAQAGGPIAYDATFQTEIGGYPKGAVVASAATVGIFWLSTADNNTTDPDTGGAGWIRLQFNISPSPFVRGLIVGNNTGTPTTKMDVAYTAILLTSASGLGINFGGGGFTIDLTTGTSSPTANGMDGHAVPATSPLYVYAISDGTAIAGIASANGPTTSGPSLPPGYSYFKYLGAMMTDGSANLYSTTQKRDRTGYVVTASGNTTSLRLLASGSAGSVTVPTWVSKSLSGFIPPIASEGEFVVSISAVSGSVAIVAPNSNYGGYNSALNPPPGVAANASGGSAQANYCSFDLESADVFYASNASDGRLFVQGWRDPYV